LTDFCEIKLEYFVVKLTTTISWFTIFSGKKISSKSQIFLSTQYEVVLVKLNTIIRPVKVISVLAVAEGLMPFGTLALGREI
jgi:hypothetical protein